MSDNANPQQSQEPETAQEVPSSSEIQSRLAQYSPDDNHEIGVDGDDPSKADEESGAVG